MSATYVAAGTLADALEAMSTGARPVAGGTDLVVGARTGKAALPEALVAIHRVDELRGVREDGGRLVLGALATHADIEGSAVVRERFTALADALGLTDNAVRTHIAALERDGIVEQVGMQEMNRLRERCHARALALASSNTCAARQRCTQSAHP